MPTDYGTTSYLDTTTTRPAKYGYRLAVFNPVGYSAPVETSITLPARGPSASLSLEARALAWNNIELTWVDTPERDGSYQVERKDPSGVFAEIAEAAASSRQFVDCCRDPATTYVQRLRFRSGGQESPPSPEASATTPWRVERHPGMLDAGFHTDNVLDHNQDVHVAYYDAGERNLRYATLPAAELKSFTAWAVETVDAAGDVGRFASIAVDSKNRVHVAYYDSTQNDLKYALKDGSSWQVVTVDSDGDVGKHASIAVGRQDEAHISFYKEVPPTRGHLRYATNRGGAWQAETIDDAGGSGNLGMHTSIAVDPAGKAHVVCYYVVTSPMLDSFDGLLYGTNAGGKWDIQIVEEGNDPGAFTSIALDASGRVHIAYYEKSFNRVKYA